MSDSTTTTTIVTGESTPAPTPNETALIARLEKLETKFASQPAEAAATSAAAAASTAATAAGTATQAAHLSDQAAHQAQAAADAANLPKVPAGAATSLVDLSGLSGDALIRMGIEQRRKG